MRGQWPWMVAVTKVASPNQIWCGATMVSDRWALSAAHCFRKPDRNDPTKYLLRIGEHDLNKSGILLFSSFISSEYLLICNCKPLLIDSLRSAT